MISEHLFEGKENAITSKDLCKLLGMNQRELTKQIQTERNLDIPICASCNKIVPGYYLAENKEAMQEYCKSLLQRMREIARTYRSCKRMIDNLPERGSDGMV